LNGGNKYKPTARIYTDFDAAIADYQATELSYCLRNNYLEMEK